MTQVLPSGTVSLVFSDVEGSTALLSRLGPRYAEALTGQREVQRAAWSAHGGTEMGTEGDSFFVVFSTAPAAVAAVAQAQQDLARFPWPDGVRVAVRMGVHTGNPAVHDGGYVGMDVHRAARIAGSAHGGQIVVSAATADLSAGKLPDGVGVRDLGSVQLKDLPAPERLFQITGPGLEDRFPPLRSVGAVSSLPRPGTELVGRDGELAELTALLAGSGVRLVSLTGPGGSGKTRLAIAVATGLVGSFPDGVFFVALAAVTAADVMWTTIAEVLDVPAEGRIPPGLFTHVAHRTALFVLDNLEQVRGADTVVAELLREAPQSVVITTTRRPLHVRGEHEHPVPPLELPEAGSNFADVETAGAVQLFVQHATMVRPSFTLTRENAADVVGVCRGLDGLPLAIELAAARTKLLSPKAVLSRLGQALDVKGAAVDRPSRQQTLRDTINWSYQLLTAQQQAVFRRLGIFAGGADLDAITAVTTDLLDGVDPLDLVGDLVDASLVRVVEAPDGEPRVTLLETIRSYAQDQLHATGEYDPTARSHTTYYLTLAEEWEPRMHSQDRVSTRVSFETEHGNLRAALAWSLASDASVPPSPGDATLGLRLCLAATEFWGAGAYFSEARSWLELAISRAGGGSPEAAEILIRLSRILRIQGDLDRAHELGTAGLAILRRLDDATGTLGAFIVLAILETERGHPAAARSLFEEAVAAAQSAGEPHNIARALGEFALFEAYQGNYERSLALGAAGEAAAHQTGDIQSIVTTQHNQACTLRQMGRAADAEHQMHGVIGPLLALNEPERTAVAAEDLAAILADLGRSFQAVHLFGAADAARDRLSAPRGPWQDADLAEPVAKTRAALTPQEWDAAYQAGRGITVEDALTDIIGEPGPT